MSPRTRWIGLAVVAGFLSIAARSAGLVPSNCCAAAHGRCPVTICKAGLPETVSKVEAAPASEVGTLSPLALCAHSGTAAAVTQGPSFLPHAFRRPMRN